MNSKQEYLMNNQHFTFQMCVYALPIVRVSMRPLTPAIRVLLRRQLFDSLVVDFVPTTPRGTQLRIDEQVQLFI